MNTDLTRLRQDAVTRQSTEGAPSSGDNRFLKLSPGWATLRFFDGGNPYQNLPYKIHKRHDVPRPNGDASYILCWDWIASDKMNIGKVLGNKQLLDKPQADLYSLHGCPICKAGNAAVAAGLGKDVTRRFWPSEKFTWNVINRADGQNYILTTSKTWGGSILNAMLLFLDNNLNPLDLRSGFDYKIRVEGHKLMRRYKDGSFMPIPSPAFTNNQVMTPYDLTDVTCINFRKYQETIDALSNAFGEVLAHIGYSIPGDSNNWNNYVSATAAKLETPNPMVAPSPVQSVTVADTQSPADYFNQQVPPSAPDVNILVSRKPEGKKVPGMDEPFDGKF